MTNMLHDSGEGSRTEIERLPKPWRMSKDFRRAVKVAREACGHPMTHKPMISFRAIAHMVTAMSASSTRHDDGLVKIGRNHFAP